MSTTADRTTAVTGAWQSDPTHSTIGFRVLYMGIAPFEGAFREFDATLDEDGLRGTAQATSVDVDNEQLSEHLASPDFFDVANHPELRFEGAPLTVDADGVVRVEGNLVVKGNSAPVTLSGTLTDPVTDPYGNTKRGLTLHGTVDRASGPQLERAAARGRFDARRRGRALRLVPLRRRRGAVTVRILGISGSLRAGSHNTQLLRLAAEELPEGVDLELYEDLAAIPPFDQDLIELAPDEVERLKDAVAVSDAILVATPEFNGSIPGQLKNAVDWVSRPLADNPARGKPVAVIGASTSSFGGIWAQRELRKVLGILGAKVLDVELPVAKADRRLDNPDLDLRTELARVVDALVAAVEGEGSTSGSVAASAMAA